MTMFRPVPGRQWQHTSCGAVIDLRGEDPLVELPKHRCGEDRMARIVTVDQDDLATAAEIARWAGVGRSTVAMWLKRQPTNGFPVPVISAGTARLWSKKEVATWVDGR